MGDPVSVTSKVVVISSSTLHATTSLYQTIDDFRNSKRAARELGDEVRALSQTLEVLKNAASDYEAELALLKLPLLQCGVVCKELSNLIDQYVTRSGGSKTNLRDWTRVQYLGDDITNYRHVLANYKETIDIALRGATMHSPMVSRQVLHLYEDMIQNTTSDLRDRLVEFQRNLSTGQFRDDPDATISREELQKIEDEIRSTRKCLDVCNQVSGNIKRNQARWENYTKHAADIHDTPSQGNYNPSIAQENAQKDQIFSVQNISAASNRLEEYLNRLEANLQLGQVAFDFQKINQQRETITQCLNTYTDASPILKGSRVNIFEDVVSLDHTQQILVSTTGNLLIAKRISTGARSLQVLGQVSDETLQHMNSRHHDLHEDVAVDIEQKEKTGFHYRWGTGRPLQDENSARKPGDSRPTP
ncbi:hypothetical protein BJX64DRAFT_258534 [Aspergillus heterothallicus]